MYEPLPEKLSYSALEQDVLKFWEDNNIFEQTLEASKNSPEFSFFEGPPTVNGKPGIHHVMARALKDAICRYKSLRGFHVRRQGGWDTHGLPVEIAVSKDLNLMERKDIVEYGIDKFNKACKDLVYKNIDMNLGWKELTRRMGYWVNMEEAYITCTTNYVESVWWALKSFYDKGLIYKGFKVVPQSPTIETPLSSHELSLGYKDVKDPNVYLKLKIESSNIKEIVGKKIIVWTTTPWTLFANVALAIGENIDYVLVKNTRKFGEEFFTEEYVLAESRLSALDGEYEILSRFKGSDLVGTRYEQILKYVDLLPDQFPQGLSILPGDFVSTEDGTGVVHLAPAFGVDDYEMSKKFKIPFVQPVTPNGHLTAECGPEFGGRAIKTFKYQDGSVEEGSDKDIVKFLKANDKIYKASFDYLHSYPHCWRTENPIMYYARDSWFIKSPEYKERMIELNKEINWQPPEIGVGRFGNWLEDVKEWSLSRDRFWGTPLPIWIAEDKSDMFAIGSIAELMEGVYEYPDGTRKPMKETGLEVDLHRPFVDHVVFEKNGKTYRRTPEIIDVWFDSGSMPFAQFHYPFENKELFAKQFPGDFIAEGIDQTRGWFYTLHNIATALFDKPAFKNIIVNELILDKKGVKMSKSKGNAVDPFEIMDKFGADAARWYLLAVNPPWKTKNFNEEDIGRTVISDVFRSLTNTYAFFALYANIDKFDGTEAEIPLSERPEIDLWIISRVNTLVNDYTREMDAYDITKAHRFLQSFMIDELSNWYIRRNRRRFWKGEKDAEKIAAYQTLKQVLIVLSKLMASAAPFLADFLFQKLRNENDPISVHLTSIPEYNASEVNEDLERKMAAAQIIVFLARSLREKSRLKTRQPLRRILLPVESVQMRRDIQSVEDIIKEEINVKEIEYVSEDAGIVKKSAKANFKTIGKKFGKATQLAANAIKAFTEAQVKEIEKIGFVNVAVDGQELKIDREDVEIMSEDIEGWLVASQDSFTVALDTELTEELINEGFAREFVNRVQNLRKTSKFEVVDRIRVYFSGTEKLVAAVNLKKEYICAETLAEDVILSPDLNEEKIDINDEEAMIKVEKI